MASLRHRRPRPNSRKLPETNVILTKTTTCNSLDHADANQQTHQAFPSYRDEEEEDILDEGVDRPLISRGGLLTELEAPYVAEAERLERFDSGSDGRRYDIIKLPHIGGGIVNSIINMSNSIIGAGIAITVGEADGRDYWTAVRFQSGRISSWDCIVVFTDWSCGLDDSVGKIL